MQISTPFNDAIVQTAAKETKSLLMSFERCPSRNQINLLSCTSDPPKSLFVYLFAVPTDPLVFSSHKNLRFIYFVAERYVNYVSVREITNMTSTQIRLLVSPDPSHLSLGLPAPLSSDDGLWTFRISLSQAPFWGRTMDKNFSFLIHLNFTSPSFSRSSSRNGPFSWTNKDAVLSAWLTAGCAKSLEFDNSQNFSRCCCFCDFVSF